MSTEFGFKCPAGGNWYSCGQKTSRFVGCCTSDPCGGNGCVQGDIRPGGFNASMHGKFPDASCGTASNFFTCTAGQTFWGCCKSNPCAATPAATCPTNDIVPAFLERPEQFNTYLAGQKSNDESNNGAVIGGAVGGGLGAIIITAVLIFFVYRRRKRNQKESSPEAGISASTPMMKERPEERLSAQYGGQSPPPTYSSPNPNYYQSMSPGKDHPYHQSYHEYRHQANEPQELPADISSPVEQRYSELPAEASGSGTQRLSELPTGATQATVELESPQPSPRPLQTEFSTDLAKQVNQAPGATSDQRPREKN